jgi:uncharacterized membrane protein
MTREQWHRRLVALGAFLFLGSFVVAHPVFGFGRFVPVSAPRNNQWIWPDWLGFIAVAGFVLLVISAFLRRR